MEFNVEIPPKGFIVSYKNKKDNEIYYLKVNAYNDQAALIIAKEYIRNNTEDCEVVKIETIYKNAFLGVIN